MATLEEMFPSRFLKAADLGGKGRVVEIVEVGTEDLKDMQGKTAKKTIVYFRGLKPLVLNKTNAKALIRITGEPDNNNWVEHRALIFPTTTEMAGETVACIRFDEVPTAKPAKKAAPPKAKAAAEEEEPPQLTDEEVEAARRRAEEAPDFDDPIDDIPY